MFECSTLPLVRLLVLIVHTHPLFPPIYNPGFRYRDWSWHDLRAAGVKLAFLNCLRRWESTCCWMASICCVFVEILGKKPLTFSLLEKLWLAPIMAKMSRLLRNGSDFNNKLKPVTTAHPQITAEIGNVHSSTVLVNVPLFSSINILSV